MIHAASDETRVLKASRFKWAVLIFAGTVFAMGGVLIFFAASGGQVGGILVFVFFGACAAVAAIHTGCFVEPPTLSSRQLKAKQRGGTWFESTAARHPS